MPKTSHKTRLTALLSLMLLAAWVCFRRQPGEMSSQRQDVSDSQSGHLITIDYIDANGDYVGSPMFGSSDEILIGQSIQLALPQHTNDFLAIGNDNAAREAFWTGNGNTFAHQDKKWSVAIAEHGLVGGDLRLAVTADAGVNVQKNVAGDSYETVDIDATVFELWKLEEGVAPQLLERSEVPFYGLQTHAEHPVNMNIVPSTEVFGDGVGYMGELNLPDDHLPAQ